MEENGAPKLDSKGNSVFTGYCMEFLDEMSKLLNFDYDVILPTDNCKCFGQKQEDGTWTGLIGKQRLIKELGMFWSYRKITMNIHNTKLSNIFIMFKVTW